MSEKEEKVTNSVLNDGTLSSGQSSRTELGARIRIVADTLGSRKDAAKAAGVSEDMVYRYIRGESEPPLAVAVGLARASGFALQWIILGEGPMKTGPQVTDEHSAYTPPARDSVDLERLEEAIRAVETYLAKQGVARPPEVKAELVAYFYDRSLRKDRVEKNDLVGLLDLIY